MADVVAIGVKEDTVSVCPACGGKGGQHTEVYIPWPWPFNKSVFRIMDCPLKEK